MLSASARPLIAASVPVLREYGEAITRCFYHRMFEAHPELKSLFNLGNQASGAQQQALAGAVYAYAANIDNREALAPVLSRIAHKHASVGITPAQYTIVGKYLLGAIAEVLGAAATLELLAAWDEAYWLLAVELIAMEARLYQQAQHKPGNWQEMRVIRKEQESDVVTSLYLQPVDGKPLPHFRPGQYISVALDVESIQHRQLRQYSLSDAPGKDWWRITVKRESINNEMIPAGMISNMLHDQVEVGSTLCVSPPFGDFVLNEDVKKPLVLLSAGVGVTPMISMLNSVKHNQPERPVVFAHAARNGRLHAMKKDILDAKNRSISTIIFYEEPADEDRQGKDYDHQGRMRLDKISDINLPLDADYYLCGPVPFMREQRRTLLDSGIDPTRIRCEVFGPDLLNGLH